MSLFRRAGAEFLKLLQQASDPSPISGIAQIYAKLSGGVTKIFMQDSGGSVAQMATIGSGVSAGDPLNGGTSGSVLFDNGGTIGEDNANLFWDATNHRLGLRTTTPGVALDVASSTTTAAIALRSGSTAGVSALGTGRLRFNESTNKMQFSENGNGYVDFGSGSGGGTPAWVAGTYTAGQTVTRGPYVWRANTTTSEDPFLVEGNLGLNSDWTFVTGGTPGTTQTSTATDGAPNGKILLMNGSTGSQVTAFRQSVNSGVFGKWLIVDLQISGTADLVLFGFYDSSLAQTSATAYSATGFYGIELDIYDPGTAEISARANGARVGSTQAYSNASFTNVGSAFSRWYAKFIQNGSNWDVELYRPARIAATFPFSAFNVNQEDDLALIFRQTNIAAPSFTNWRFVLGSQTGGSALISSCRAAYVRNAVSNAWSCIGRIPTQII